MLIINRTGTLKPQRIGIILSTSSETYVVTCYSTLLSGKTVKAIYFAELANRAKDPKACCRPNQRGDEGSSGAMGVQG